MYIVTTLLGKVEVLEGAGVGGYAKTSEKRKIGAFKNNDQAIIKTKHGLMDSNCGCAGHAASKGCNRVSVRFRL